MTASYLVIFSLLELDTHAKIKRVLLIGGKIAALLALLYLFICSLSFLTSAFRLLSGVKTGENLPYIQYSMSICKTKLTASQIRRHWLPDKHIGNTLATEFKIKIWNEGNTVIAAKTFPSWTQKRLAKIDIMTISSRLQVFYRRPALKTLALLTHKPSLIESFFP